MRKDNDVGDLDEANQKINIFFNYNYHNHSNHIYLKWEKNV